MLIPSLRCSSIRAQLHHYNYTNASERVAASVRFTKSLNSLRSSKKAEVVLGSHHIPTCITRARAPQDSDSDYEVEEVVITEDGSDERAPGEAEDEVVYQVIEPSDSFTIDAPKDAAQSWLQLALVVVAVAGLGGALFFLRKRLIRSDAGDGTERLDPRKLQKESEARLNEFMDELRNEVSASLSAKNLGDEGIAYISDGLAFNEFCTSADLSKNGVGTKGTTQLCQALSHNNTLQTLILDTNNLGDDGAELIAGILATNASLQRVDLSSNNIGDQGATVLAEALKLNTTLLRLELNGNAIDESGTQALAEAVKANSVLQSLSISDNYLGEAGAKLLADALKENESITELSLKGNELGDEGIQHICHALLARKTRTRKLDLGNNSMTTGGVTKLAELVKRAQLSDLNLYMNDLGNEGIKQVAAALQSNGSLVSLDVNGNNIGAEGIIALAEAVKGIESLRHLEVSYNPIEARGAKAIVDVLKFGMQVENLKMGWCKLGKTDGAAAVADLIMFNTTLHSLDVRGNGFEDNGAILLSRALKEHTNEKLTDLDLGYNEIKDDGACQIAQALKGNPDRAPLNLKVNANYITRLGQTALVEALDTVYELSGSREMNITF